MDFNKIINFNKWINIFENKKTDKEDNENIEDISKKIDNLEPEYDEIDFSTDEYDSITLSDKLLMFLEDMKVSNNLKFKVGDKIILVNNRKGKMTDDAFNYINNRKILKILRINKSNKLDLGFFRRYTKEDDGKVKKVKKVFYYSNRRFSNLNNYDDVAKLLLELQFIKKSNLLNYPIDFIDIDKKGNFSGISRRNLNPGENGFESKRRQKLKFVKMLRRIVTPEYYEKNIDVKKIEKFMNKWTMLFDDTYTVDVLEGDRIIDAYNQTKISKGWHHSSCANFKDEKSLRKGEFDFYTKNPNNIKCLVVYHKGKIYGRRMLFTGIQTEDHGKFKKGQKYTLLNYMYGEGGRGSKVDKLMTLWAKENNVYLIENITGSKDVIKIKIEETCFNYPPVDYLYVNFNTNEISTRAFKGFVSAYHAQCNHSTKIRKKIKQKIRKK